MRFAEGLLDHERSVMCIVSVLLTDMIRTMLLEERVRIVDVALNSAVSYGFPCQLTNLSTTNSSRPHFPFCLPNPLPLTPPWLAVGEV